MPSIIFVTLKDGEYDDHWMSKTNTLLADENTRGHRQLHWCGQRNNNPLDDIVQPTTLVAVRNKKKDSWFTIIGSVVRKDKLTPKIGKNPATYEITVELDANPRRIQRADGDRCAHWTVLRELNLGIPFNEKAWIAKGIYGV